MILSSLYTYLTNQSNITDLVSTRIYPSLPESAGYPSVSYLLVDQQHSHNLSAASGVAVARVQIDTWSDLLSDVDSVSEQLRQSLEGFSGTMGSDTVHHCWLTLDRDTTTPAGDGSDAVLYRRTQEYQIKYIESIP